MTINGLSCNINLLKINTTVFCTIVASGSLTSNRGLANAIPEDFRSCFSSILIAKNVTSSNYGADYGVTRYLITNTGDIDIVSDKKDFLERHASGCWITK